MGMPSSSSEANASASAWPQSIPPSSRVSRRRSSWRASFGWTVKPSGTARSCSFSARSRSSATAVSTASPVPVVVVGGSTGGAGGSAIDARSYELHLTNKGKRILQRAGEVQSTHEQRLIERIGPEGREQLLRLLGKLTDIK